MFILQSEYNPFLRNNPKTSFMNILFTWKYRKEILYIDCTLTKNGHNHYDTWISVQKEDKDGGVLFAFEILNILGNQQYRFLQGKPDDTMLRDIKEVILEQFDIIRPCHLN